MGSRIYMLVKVFDKEEYADAFLQHGEMLCRTLGEFKRIEGDEARGDKYEGVTDWHQPDQVKVTISYKDQAGVEHLIPIEKLAGPMIIQNSHLDDYNLFCTYAVKIDVPDETYETREALLEAVQKVNDGLMRQMAVNDEAFSLGHYAVVVYQVEEFFERVEKTVESLGADHARSPVIYYDPETFHGSFKGVQAAFRKRSTYAYQNEYRFLFDFPGTVGTKTFQVGALSDIAFKVTCGEINSLLKLKLYVRDEADVVLSGADDGAVTES